MLKCVWNGRPALKGIAPLVEERCEAYGIDLDCGQARKAVGALCAVCLRPFGYIPSERKSVDKDKPRHFKRAATYQEGSPKTREARIQIVDLESE